MQKKNTPISTHNRYGTDILWITSKYLYICTTTLFFIHCRLFLMFTSRTTIRQYREMTRQRISSFYCKHAAELWQASLMCVLIDDPHSESFGYQLGSDAYTANGASISLQKNKKLSKPVWLYNVSTNMIRKASLAGVKFSVLQVCGNY